MIYVMLKRYLYDSIDCVMPTVATERGKVYKNIRNYDIWLDP